MMARGRSARAADADPSADGDDRDREDEKKEAVFDDPGALKVRIEPGLVESMCEDWYRSWCLPDSDTTWGGPKGSRTKRRGGNGKGGLDESRASSAVDGASLHPMSKVPAGDLFLRADEIEPPSQLPSSGEMPPAINEVDVDVDSTYSQSCLPPSSDPFDYRWDSFETREQVHDRMERVAETLARRHPDDTVVLVSHGGPVTHLFERLAGPGGGSGEVRHGTSKYSGCSVYKWREEEGGEDGVYGEKRLIWTCLMANDTGHIE